MYLFLYHVSVDICVIRVILSGPLHTDLSVCLTVYLYFLPVSLCICSLSEKHIYVSVSLPTCMAVCLLPNNLYLHVFRLSHIYVCPSRTPSYAVSYNIMTSLSCFSAAAGRCRPRGHGGPGRPASVTSLVNQIEAHHQLRHAGRRRPLHVRRRNQFPKNIPNDKRQIR